MYGAGAQLRDRLERLVSAWDTELAFERARVAYRYVAANFPDTADLEVLAPYTAKAHEAELAEDMEAFEDALRELMRAAKAEAMHRKAGAA
jgi:hypothetical protein